MVMKHLYNPKQRMLGCFVDGLPKKLSELPRTVKDALDMPIERSSYSPRKLEEGEYAWNDLIRPCVDVLMGLVGVRVLVCPTCKRDVEPIFPHYVNLDAKGGEVELFRQKDVEKECIFAECRQCGMRFFMAELVSQRSFRMKLPKEDVRSYYPFLKVDEVKVEGGWTAWKVISGNVSVVASSGDFPE
jgi:hypothetical protein